MPYWDKDKKKWRGTVFRSGYRKQEMFNLKSDAKEWEVGQKALPLEKFLAETLTVYSLAQWSDEYLDHAKRKYVRKTYDEKARAFRWLFLSVKPELEPARLHPGIILKHFEKAAKERSGNAANKDRKNLIAAWNWASKYIPDWPASNPFSKTEKQTEERMPRYIPPVEDFWKVYDSVSEGQDKVMLFTYLHTAARRSELFILKWEEVDFRKNRIQLWTRKRKGGLEADWIPMTAQLKATLQWWNENRTFPEHENVFVCEDRNNFCKNLYSHPFQVRQHWMKKLCEDVEVKPFGLHAIRHLSASILDDAGQPIAVIQALLRHKNANTTAKYLHALRGLRVELGHCFQRPLPVAPEEIQEVVSGDSKNDQAGSRLRVANKNDRPAPQARATDRSFLRVVK
jgi:integrase